MDHLFLSMESNCQEHRTFFEDPNDVFWNSLPPGYRFSPTDAELILYYLQRKILKQELPLNKFREVDIYQYHPQDLAAEPQFNRRGENEWYFFTPRERKYAHGSRPNRTANHGNGFWKVTGKDEAIELAADGEKIGFKNTLDYFEGTHSENQKTKWKMHEYRLKKSERDNEEEIAPSNNQKGQRDMKLDDCVLCKIYTSNRCKAGNIIIKKSKRTAKRSSADSNQDGYVQHENQNQDCGIAHPAEPINNFIQNNRHHNMLSSFDDNVINFQRWLTEATKKPKTEHHVPDGIQQSFYMPDDTLGVTINYD